jgi:hypothetical protein
MQSFPKISTESWALMLCSKAFLCFSLCVVPVFAFSQEVPKVEVFGGFSYLHLYTSSASALEQTCKVTTLGNCPFKFHVHPGFSGWNAAGQWNLNSWVGVKADVSGHYGTLVAATVVPSIPGFPFVDFSTPSQHTYDFLFGPVVTYRRYRYIPFAHALIGDEHVSFGNFQLVPGIGQLPSPASHNYFAFVLGGGVDIKVVHHLLVRAGEFDYQFVKTGPSSSGHQNGFRFSTGLVFEFRTR